MGPIRPPALLLLAAILAGCAEADPVEPPRADGAIGGAIGAGLGRVAAIGTRYPWALTGAGLAAGAAVGITIGDYLDPAPSRMWAAATVTAAEAGQPGRPVAWELRDHRGRVTMVGEGWTDAGGRPCRTLRQQSGDDGAAPLVRDVVACRSADDTWEVVPPPGDG
ncbi:MAG: hypothetical protein RLZZ501_1608 [Pseudomonadota bacterium]